MIALYLLAAHMVGDFVLQTRWQAAGKFLDRGLRMRHVWAYSVPFVPIVVWRCWGGSTWHEQRGVIFIGLLVLLHFATDSRRFLSTLGDVIGWDFSMRANEDSDATWPPPNPWPPIAILIDQTLHVCQLAILGGVFLT